MKRVHDVADGDTVVAEMASRREVRSGNGEGGRTAPPADQRVQWPDATVCEMALLILKAQHAAEKIAKKAGHLVESRRYPQDCLRNAEVLEDCATQLLTHARQIIRRALEKQQ